MWTMKFGQKNMAGIDYNIDNKIETDNGRVSE